MATKTIIQPLTGKPLPPKAPTWPVTVAKWSWRLFLLTLLLYGGLNAALRSGGAPEYQFYLELGVAGMAVICILLALWGVVGAFLYKPGRGSALVNAFVGILIVGLVGVVGAMNFLAAREVELRNREVLEAFRLELAESANLPHAERGKRVARGAHTAADNSTGEQQRWLETTALGLDSINGPYVGQEKAWAAFKEAGAVDPEKLGVRGALAARRKLLANAMEETQRLETQLTLTSQTWLSELERTKDRETMLDVFVREPSAAAKRTQAVAKEMDAVLAALDESAGRWSLKKGKLVFKKKADQLKYEEALARLNALTAEPKATADAKLEPIDVNEARQYATSYVALVQRSELDEAYKYLPPDVRAKVSEKDHAAHWQRVGNGSLDKIAVDENTNVPGGPIGFRIAVPGAKEPEIVVVVKTGGKVYSTPLAFMPK